MKCPTCGKTSGIEIDMHSDGYVSDLMECSNCETLWTVGLEGVALLTKKAA